METLTQRFPATQGTAEGDGLSHIIECHNDNLTLCGLDAANIPWGPNPSEPDCAVCDDLEPLHCGCDCGCCDEDDAE